MGLKSASAGLGFDGVTIELLFDFQIQRSPLFCASTFKKDPGRAGQNSLATAGTNYTKPGAHNKGDLCMFNQRNVAKN